MANDESIYAPLDEPLCNWKGRCEMLERELYQAQHDTDTIPGKLRERLDLANKYVASVAMRNDELISENVALRAELSKARKSKGKRKSPKGESTRSMTLMTP